MRRCRINLPNRCYHLISRVAHRAYFLDEDERTRLVDFVRRVAEFSGVKLLAYSVMSNHFHVFVYIGRPEPLSDAEIVRRISALYWRGRTSVRTGAARHLRLGLRRREYFTKAYLRPLMETGLIERSDPGHPNSPQQKYVLTKDGRRRIERVAPL